MININCQQNDRGAWCKDKRVRRSLLGIGVRCCKIFEGDVCEYQKLYARPDPVPPGIKEKKLREGRVKKDGENKMKKEDINLINQVSSILSDEGYKGFYDGEQAKIFWEAERWLDKALKIIKKEGI